MNEIRIVSPEPRTVYIDNLQVRTDEVYTSSTSTTIPGATTTSPTTTTTLPSCYWTNLDICNWQQGFWMAGYNLLTDNLYCCPLP
ncbi:MAG: hypothetical protein ABH851_05595 [Methanobacteriota archaeon]